jgi:hypothetical protein
MAAGKQEKQYGRKNQKFKTPYRMLPAKQREPF